MHDLSELVRKTTLQTLAIEYPEVAKHDLPLLEGSLTPRNEEEVNRRALAMFAICAVAYGFDTKLAYEWLVKNNLIDSLTSRELDFLSSGSIEKTIGSELMESLYVLTWVTGHVSSVSLTSPIPKDFVKIFPDIRINEDPATYLMRANHRSERQILEQLDLSYYLHWWAVSVRIGSNPARQVQKWEKLEPIIELRRHALEWCLEQLSWDDINLDT